MPDIENDETAAQLILQHCPSVGSAAITSPVYTFLDTLRDAVSIAPTSELFGGRHKEHVACAIRGGASLVHGVQIRNVAGKLSM